MEAHEDSLLSPITAAALADHHHRMAGPGNLNLNAAENDGNTFFKFGGDVNLTR